MAFLKKYCSLKANSILESIIALTIISICLYFAILIFAAVFTPRTSAKFYNTQNKVNELFFLAELKSDSLSFENEDENLLIQEEQINESIKKVSIQYKDSTKFQFNKSFYIQTNE
ncbi:hypothetical protein [Flavobacterium sp.]|uniref:hypothetical protein n=1 Tax=Flavobacterium sp. TaxID=239 RepID=UPI003D6BD92A